MKIGRTVITFEFKEESYESLVAEIKAWLQAKMDEGTLLVARGETTWVTIPEKFEVTKET